MKTRTWTTDVMSRMYAEASEGIVIENGLIRYDRPGHTRQVAHLKHCHEGRVSAGYYALGRLLDVSEPGEGARTLQALAELQIRNSADDRYGAFRWYAEEREVQDSNAAFFILMPLVSLRLKAPEAVPAEHAAIMDGMLRRAAFWFERECREPELFYPNKTMSDGAMLLAISHLLGDAERLDSAADYFDRWESYTSRRGWGWGENLSLVYQGVMLNALEIAEPLLRGVRPKLAERLARQRRSLLDILRFHDGTELVPTIRSYNFGGELRRPSLAWMIAGVTGTNLSSEASFHVNDLSTLLLFDSAFEGEARSPQGRHDGEDRKNGQAGRAMSAGVPRIREERVFDDAFAYSWIGRRTRLGSLNRFPVIPGSYQHEAWGLGWQSFPLSAAAEGGQVSYARWSVDDGETVRTHPAESYKTAYLMPALFRDSPYPGVRTFAAQREHALLALRVLDNVRQPAAEIADEWVVPGFAGEAAELPGVDGRRWHVLRYAGAAIAISPLQSLTFGLSPEAAGAYPDAKMDEVRKIGTRGDGESGGVSLKELKHRPGVLIAERDEARLKLRQILHVGEPGLLLTPRLQAGWAVICLDDANDEGAIRDRLSRIVIEDAVLDDREVPREPHERIRCVRLLENGREQVRLELDPHRPKVT
ncbi:hypothetical protein [Saccharibacillus endophyticus]|uniref:Uncharacterized protein n=1 Tax=Saccharibacillus endophyticus TaxID=2060666 RepID=A0ABQ1ZTE5_9BACL|nr:hypothetical protein [Saccharibacillus endophyticus]GGH78178.1 hypothetical protein GCM10007362_23080 [Saccharibacillus endophyticus]